MQAQILPHSHIPTQKAISQQARSWSQHLETLCSGI